MAFPEFTASLKIVASLLLVVSSNAALPRSVHDTVMQIAQQTVDEAAVPLATLSASRSADGCNLGSPCPLNRALVSSGFTCSGGSPCLPNSESSAGPFRCVGNSPCPPNSAPALAPTATLSQSADTTRSDTVSYSTRFTITWSSTNAANCIIQKQWPNGLIVNRWATGISGSKLASPLPLGIYHWWIDCAGPGGTAHADIHHTIVQSFGCTGQSPCSSNRMPAANH